MLKHVQLLISLFCFVACMSQPGKNTHKKVVFIPGTNSHDVGEHEYLGGCQLLSKLLDEYGKDIKTVITEQGWPADTTILNDADAILIFSDGGGRHPALNHLDHLNRLMKKGTGLVLIHYSVELPKETGGNYFLDWAGGYFETNYSVNPFWKPEIKTLPPHPVTNGVKPFILNDEWYYHMRFVPGMKNITPVLTALPPASTLDRPDGSHSNNAAVRRDVLEKKMPQVIAWAYTRNGGGRSFGFTGGHIHNNWMQNDYRKLLLNAIAWTAKANIPPNGIDTPAPSQQEMDALRKKPAR